MPGPLVAASGASQIEPDASARTHSPTLNSLLDSLLSTRIIRLTDHEMRVAVIVLRLRRRRDIVLHWVRLLQLQKWRWRRGLAHLVTTEVLQMWCERFANDSIVVRCLAEPHACVRGAVHIFLVQSVLAERVQDCVRAGMLVPPSFVLGKYAGMLSMLPPCPVVDDHRTSLECHVHAAKKWNRRLREDWGLSWGSPSLPHGISEQASCSPGGIVHSLDSSRALPADGSAPGRRDQRGRDQLG